MVERSRTGPRPSPPVPKQTISNSLRVVRTLPGSHVPPRNSIAAAQAATRCGARRKHDGCPCQQPAMANGRCRLHGGKSTGAKTPEGAERARQAALRHGYYSGGERRTLDDGSNNNATPPDSSTAGHRHLKPCSAAVRSTAPRFSCERPGYRETYRNGRSMPRATRISITGRRFRRGDGESGREGYSRRAPSHGSRKASVNEVAANGEVVPNLN
jgi:hypothetical protein